MSIEREHEERIDNFKNNDIEIERVKAKINEIEKILKNCKNWEEKLKQENILKRYKNELQETRNKRTLRGLFKRLS